MTTYRHKLTLSDSETIMLEEALEMMIRHCDSEIAEGETAPFYSWLHSAREVKGRLHSDTELTSFFRKTLDQ
jgi:hypothetical protein